MRYKKIIDLELGTNKFQAFVQNIRIKKNIIFIIVNDISSELQVTVLNKNENLFNIASKLSIGSVINLEGELVSNPNVILNQKEFLPTNIEIVNLAEELPIDENSLIDHKIKYRWIDLRTKKNQLMWKVQTTLAHAMREFCVDNELLEIHSPKIISTPSESGAEVFEVNYFDSKAYLAQSPQFYKQMALAAGFGGVFETGPVFRAENSNTHKHATEFTGFDVEISNIESVDDVIKFEEDLIAFAFAKVKAKYGEEIKKLFNIEFIVPTTPFPRMDLADVIKELNQRYGYVLPESEHGDLPTEGEKLCRQLSLDMFGHEFLIVTGYDTKKRAFYHIRKDGIAQGYDLIWRGTEITTGAMREHRFNELSTQAREKGLGKSIDFYLEFFKYGAPTHGGFGIGLDRLTMLIFNKSIKESQFIFRGPKNLDP